MEVVNFRVGNYLVAFNILDILLTEKFSNDQTSMPSEDKAFLGVKDFMGTPTPIYDLGIAMNKSSTHAENQQLANLLNEREQDHENWLDALEYSVKNKQAFTLARDPAKCAFGQWYQTFTTKNEDLAEVLKRFDKPHKHIHSLADKALDMLDKGEQSEAIKLIQQERKVTLASLKRLFAIAREQLEVTYKPVTVYTTIDGRQPALGFVVDKVEDSLTVNNEQIKPLKEITQHIGNIDHRVKEMIEGLLTTQQYNSLLLSSKSFL